MYGNRDGKSYQKHEIKKKKSKRKQVNGVDLKPLTYFDKKVILLYEKDRRKWKWRCMDDHRI